MIAGTTATGNTLQPLLMFLIQMLADPITQSEEKPSQAQRGLR